MSFKKQRGGPRHQGRKDDNSTAMDVDSDNPIIREFQKYAVELDDKHDRSERLVKCSRDITIEAKRIIFLLHNIDARKNNRDQVLQEAQHRIEKLFANNFQTIARELKGFEVHQYMRSISSGIQEFIEALTFLEYLSTGEVSTDWDSIRSRLTYKGEGDAEEFCFSIDPFEFILGLADLTGEVMRSCINSISSGDIENCHKSCRFMQTIYRNYLKLQSMSSKPWAKTRDYRQKMTTMRASTLKCENVCYNLKVRGTEGSHLSLLSYEAAPEEDADEGFF